MTRALPLLLIFALSTCVDEDDRERVPLVVVAPLASADEPAREDALAVLVDTLTAMGHAPRVERLASAEWAPLFDRIMPALVIALDADALALDVPGLAPDPERRFDDRFALDLFREGRAANPIDGAPGTLVVALTSRTTLGRFYAVYELLRRLGARYYHPEDEWIPPVPLAQLTSRATRPTALGPGPVYTPDFTHRSFSFHGAHPLEHLEAFSDARHPIDEALHVNDWIIKNRGDLFRGAGRGVAPPAEAERRAAELEAFRVRRGLRRQAGISLHNQQQGASADLDPTSAEPLADQVDRIVQARLEAAPDAYGFSIHFGPTELTTTPDRETVALIDRAGRAALALRPDLQIEVNDHTTGTQPVEHYDDLGCPPGTNDRGVVDYYDLAFHTDPRFAVKVHTVMFHPLEGPAGVYQQRSFAHKLCLMQKASADGRPLVWFPEGAYWLSWDNAVPVYLPLYIFTRHRDIALLSPLLAKNGGTLLDHRLFDSGHEWGYWQQDYAVGLMHWNTDVALADVLGELADPLCAPEQYGDCTARATYVDVLTEVMDVQARAFLTAPDFRGRPGGLYTYFAGEDPADELGARSGLEFRPVRLSFRELATLSAAERAAFEEVDLAELDRLDDFFTAQAARLSALRESIPRAALPWLDEVVDGLAIDGLRARHVRALYLAVLAILDPTADAGAEVATLLDTSRATLEAARAVIARREAAYRYPLPQLIGGGVTPETAVPNGTTYPYRVHTKTHLLSYWTSRQQQVEDLVAGRSEDAIGLTLTPAFAAPDIAVDIAWPVIDGLAGAVDMGDGQSVSPGDVTHRYAAPGVYRVEGLLETAGAPLPVAGWVVRTDTRATVVQGDFALVTPDSDLARTVLASLVPPLRLALEDDAEPLLALLAEPGGRDSGHFDDVTVAAAIVSPQSISAGPFDFVLPIPDPSTGTVAAEVGLHDAALTIARAGDALGDATLEGELSVSDLVDALVALAGFEPSGAAETLAGVLGFDPADPPETVPFSAALPLTPDP